MSRWDDDKKRGSDDFGLSQTIMISKQRLLSIAGLWGAIGFGLGFLVFAK